MNINQNEQNIPEMKTKHQVHNLIILDESGSMESIKEFIISGFNELVQAIHGIEQQYTEQEHFISFVTFNGLGQKVIHFRDPAAKLHKINGMRYRPTSMTPLYDAMGDSINRLRQELEKESDYNVLVTILTDGQENASKEYSGAAIKKLVEAMKHLGWTFTYIGADHDVEKFAIDISITNVLHFKKDVHDINRLFNEEKAARARYSQKIRDKRDTGEDFYKPDEEKKS